MSIRLASGNEPEPLTFDEAKASARNAYDQARVAQLALVSDLSLTADIWRTTTVDIYRIRHELAAARRQLQLATEVVYHLEHAAEVVETTAARHQ